MSSRYALLSIGVNDAPGGNLLTFAESDAQLFARVMMSGAGPIRDPSTARVMLGRSATINTALVRLAMLAQSPPEYLLLYFSGHGNEQGIALSDGLLSYATLAAALRMIPARIKTVILDTCHAGAGLRILREKLGAVAGIDIEAAWAQALAAACPGLRVFAAVTPDRLSHEDSEVSGGRFTFALTQALRVAPGDLSNGSVSWVSDRQAFDHAQQVVAELWPQDSLPEFHAPPSIGPHLPMVLAERDQVIGSARIGGIVPIDEAFGLRVRVRTQDRRFLPTDLYADLVDARSGELIDTASVRVNTNADATLGVVDVACHLAALRRDPWHRVSLLRGQAVPCVWQVRVQDDFGRSLTYRELPRSYRIASRLPPAVGWPF